MRLLNLEINGFKSFAQKTNLEFVSPIVSVVGPNGSGKSNVVESIRFVLGEQSMKSMRGKAGADMIFKGSKNAPKGTRAKVTIYFNNADKIFKLSNADGENVDLNYDTISISREVFPDGLNKYILNGSEVRLKDIHNLLSSVNIGSSGHHIISQGEADRILNASPRDRREMVEDALGLKVYQYRIKDSERKLERTNLNMKEVTMLRRENAPHLNFLRKQVEKFEKTKEMQVELATLYREYLKKESLYLENQKHALSSEKNKIVQELREVDARIAETDDENSTKNNPKIEELRAIEKKINEIRNIKNDMERKLGRIEGMIEMEESRREQEPDMVVISQEEIKSILDEVNDSINEAIAKESMDEIKPILQSIKNILNKFNKKPEAGRPQVHAVADLKQNQAEIVSEMKKIEDEEHQMSLSAEALKRDINAEMESLRDKEREKFTWKVKHQELSSALSMINMKEENLKKGEEALENEIKEGHALIGVEVLAYKHFEIEGQIDGVAQEDLRRRIERIKIKLEDAGTGGHEVVKEFEEVSQRDAFLAKEIEDLQASVVSLEKIMADLKEKIDLEFKNGIKKINVEFQEFFSLMFGGGHGSLNVVVENKSPRRRSADEAETGYGEDFSSSDDENKLVLEQGIEIDVSLPHKKVKELHALSGGERSLTSIALLFAMSQVNPPPFLVLDETDAALDEANSRKYGDMLEKLSKYSQLIVVTHNRETMSRAGMLYGVTIGGDGASKLLSVRFDEAVAIAK
ncbi:MAG: AAA family ATPase [Candidatus Pacebacteria bacterium]|nr:AAA family ATPase [Candidatus Paceibacterota bacterium]